MSQSKKRPKRTEEDLEAAVADMINSPITRANLSFLRPGIPAEGDTKPLGSTPKPPAVGPNGGAVLSPPNPTEIRTEPLEVPDATATPQGHFPTPVGLDPLPPRGVAQRQPLWQAEGIGTVFEQSRVRRIQDARDALSKVEGQVYDLLWGTPAFQPERYRLIHYSLQRIAIDSNINIKTVRELIPRLIDKGFIAIEHPADVRRNIPTLYRVWSDTSVIDNQRQRNRRYVARTGKGVFYVHPIAVHIQTRPVGHEPEPIGLKPMGVEAEYQSSSRLLFSLSAIVQEFLGLSAEEVFLASMVAQCHENATITTGEPATDMELQYFTEVKARGIVQSANIRNHLSVLQKAVPSCFLGESFRIFRQTASGMQRGGQEQTTIEV
jgi:hypothetical protein